MDTSEMPTETPARAELAALRDVLQQSDPGVAGRIDYALRWSDADVEAFLTSGDLWGGKGSIVESSGAGRWRGARREVQDAFIALADWQIAHGYVHPRVTHWVEVLKGRHGLREQPGGERAAVPWSIRDVWWGVVAAAVIVGATFGVALMLGSISLGSHADLWISIFLAVFELLFLVPIWWFAVRKYRAPLRSLGYVRFKFSIAAIGIALLFAFYWANALYVYLLDLFGLELRGDLEPVLRGVSTPWLLIITIVIIAPVVEETFFRGFIFAGLRSRYDWRWAAVISSALFGAAHLSLTFFLPAFVLGFLFAYLYQRSNSIWPGMIVHALTNTLAVAISYLLI